MQDEAVYTELGNNIRHFSTVRLGIAIFFTGLSLKIINGDADYNVIISFSVFLLGMVIFWCYSHYLYVTKENQKDMVGQGYKKCTDIGAPSLLKDKPLWFSIIGTLILFWYGSEEFWDEVNCLFQVLLETI